jgi:hypothetical protein
MSSPRVVLVTGANRGTGLAVLQALALRSPSDHYFLGCRDLSKGEVAVQELRKLSITAPVDPIQMGRYVGREPPRRLRNCQVRIRTSRRPSQQRWCGRHPFRARFLRLPLRLQHRVRHEGDVCRDRDAAVPAPVA